MPTADQGVRVKLLNDRCGFERQTKETVTSSDGTTKVKVLSSMYKRHLYLLFQAVKQTLNSKKWTNEADDTIRSLVDKYGPKHWSLVASHVPGRTGKQCRERYKFSSFQ